MVMVTIVQEHRFTFPVSDSLKWGWGSQNLPFYDMSPFSEEVSL